MRPTLGTALLIPLVAAATIAASPPPATRPSLSSSPAANLLLGNPSGATTNVRNRDDFLIVKPFFVESYNSSKGQPNWVSWVVTAADVGDAPRKRTFDTDTKLPVGYVRIKASEYTNSGFDRGHVCPHGDRAAAIDMSYSTFVMSNIIPQAPNVNRKAWVQVEDYGRTLALEGNHVYIIAGGSGVGGVGSNDAKVVNSISDGRVAVPAKCWKILVVVPEAGGDDDLAKINADTRVIAVHVPNDHSAVTDAWKQYRVSVNTLERETGYTFFTTLPPDVAKALKSKTDDAATPVPVRRICGQPADGDKPDAK